MIRKPLLILALIVSTATYADVSTVNKGLDIPPGTEADANYSSVNGSLTVGAGSDIHGSCSTVNGGLRVGDDCTIDEVTTVNGGVRLGSGVRVLMSASTVNGSIKTGEGCAIGGDLTTVNGSISLTDGTVGKDIQSVNGDIHLSGKSEVMGDIVIRKAKNRRRWSDKTIDIYVKDQSVVRGDIRVEDKYAEVTVHIAPDAEVVGVVSGAKVVETR